MEFQQLRYFVALARERNFSRAATACSVSQPSLSQQFRKLEEELGEPLFRRTRKGAVLTEFGEILLPQAQQLLADAERIFEEARSRTSNLRGRVVLGAIPTIAPYLLPGIIGACASSFPQLELKLVEETTDVLISRMLDGHLDFCLLSPPFDHAAEFASQFLLEDELLIALASGHPLKTSPRISLVDLADFPIVLMKETHCLSRQSILLCESSGLHPNLSIESSQLETVVSLVESGLGFSFIPKLAMAGFTHRRVVFRSIHPDPVSRALHLVWPKHERLTRVQETFLRTTTGLFQGCAGRRGGVTPGGERI